MGFSIKPIKTEKDYLDALKILDKLFNANPNSLEGDHLEILSILIEKYEEEHYPIEAPDPIEAIKFRMEQMDMKTSDLGKVIGYKSRASEILNRKRKLNLNMIRKISTMLKIPASILVQDYDLAS